MTLMPLGVPVWGGIMNKHMTDVESPHHPRLCMKYPIPHSHTSESHALISVGCLFCLTLLPGIGAEAVEAQAVEAEAVAVR